MSFVNSERRLRVRVTFWPNSCRSNSNALESNLHTSLREAIMLFRRRTSPWKAGILFYDSRDPRIVVGNRFGLGWTLNLANKWAWALVGAFGAAAIYSRGVRASYFWDRRQ